jgi:hypothetical protein
VVIASVLAKRAVFRLRSNLPYSGAVSSQVCQRRLSAGFCSARRQANQAPKRDRHHDAVAAHEVRHRQHDDGQQRQLLLGVGEHRDDLRHHIGQQEDHDRERHHRDDGRIGERQAHLLHQRIAAFDVVGQARQHARQLADLLAGRDQRAVDIGKVARMRASASDNEAPPITSERIEAIRSRT